MRFLTCFLIIFTISTEPTIDPQSVMSPNHTVGAATR